MDIILIAGLWLRASSWDDVATALRDLGHRPVPLAVPGADDGSTTATLDAQVAAAVAAVDSTGSASSSAGGVMVVGHSAASSLAWIVADRRPGAVSRAVMVGGFPKADEEAYADFFETVDGVMPFPGWAPFEGPDAADLDEPARERLVAGTVPVPEGVSKGIVRLTDERRLDVPVTLVCPEYTPEEAQEWIKAGEIPELTAARHVSFLDIDSGHWPMFSRPADLARVLHAAASGS